MAKIDKAAALALLRAANPTTPLGDLTVYAEAFVEYSEAAENIAANGTIVGHPRSGAPIENPFCAVRSRASKTMQGCRVKRTDSLWRAAAK